MESLFYRYRNITVLLVVLFAQLVLLAWQVKSDKDVPLVRVWAISAVAPVASSIEGVRNETTGFFSNYFELKNARAQSQKLRTEVDSLRLENQFLKNELESARRAEALAGFQSHSLSKMIGARVIGTTSAMGSKAVLIDRGTAAGVRKGMAVVTPDGIVGRVMAVYPFASQVMGVTDPGFAAGVESQKNHTHGVLKGVGNESARIDYVPTGQKIDVGEMVFTSGEDRIFPKGLPVGKITSVKEGSNFQEIYVQPTAVESAPEEVLVIVDPVHQEIPEAPASDAPVFLAPDVKPDSTAGAEPGAPTRTTADQMLEQYKKIGAAQNHQFGEGGPGTPPPNFNLKVPGVNAPAAPAGAPAKPGVPGASGATQPRTATPAGSGSAPPNSVKPPAPPGSQTIRTAPPAVPGSQPAARPPVVTAPGAVSGAARPAQPPATTQGTAPPPRPKPEPVTEP
ncbi:MAG TPA: rod shape-determining protein MreC [Bryobacteraceae bacterium]|nr:rod shape-determining protein MreC [Bryobacteraceae bacterium]